MFLKFCFKSNFIFLTSKFKNFKKSTKKFHFEVKIRMDELRLVFHIFNENIIFVHFKKLLLISSKLVIMGPFVF